MTMNLLQMSLYGAVLILVITALRAIAINRLPKKTFLILWGIAMVRLLIPYELPSALSVYSLIGSDTPAAAVEETEAYYENYSPVSPSVSFEPSEKLKPSEPKEQTPPLSSENHGFGSVLLVIWLSGSILLAAFFTLSYLHCYFEFKTSLPAENEFTRQWLIEHKIKRPLSIRQSDKITVPLTYGVFRPVILMPKQTDWENTKQLRYVLLHEYVHVCRFDAFLKLICVFVLCLHWFNPAVWLMYALFNRDIELACDEGVVKKSGLSSKAEYALMLIGTEEKKAGLMPLFSGFGKNCAKERIVAVMKIKKASALAVAAAVILTAGVSAAFATSAENGEINSGEKARETAFSENIADPKMYEEYKPFGLTVNLSDSKLYYGGKLVRCFDDRIPTGFFSEKAIGYYEKNGVIDVRAVRENSKLTGLEVLSQEEFDGRTIKEDVSSNDTASGTSMFDIYLEYGLEYDKAQNALFYGDKRVRLFWDCLSSDSKPSASDNPFISTVSNWDENGTVDLYAVRDYRQKDENGYGKITGLRIADQQEFENNTSLFADRNEGTEYADGNAAVTVPENSVGFEGMVEREEYGEIYGGEGIAVEDTKNKDFDWDWGDDDFNWDWDDDDNFDWDWDDKVLMEAYAAYGIEKDGKSFYYKGEPVYIIMDPRPDSSFYLFDINSKGTVSIKVIRNTEGKITGVSYMTEEEVTKILSERIDEEYEEIHSGETVDSFSFFNVKSGQYALSEAVYEIKEDFALFNYAVNWEPMGNYIQVGLISTDKSHIYSDSCISGRASGSIEVPSGSYYVMVYNEPSSDIDLNGTVAYSFNKW